MNLNTVIMLNDNKRHIFTQCLIWTFIWGMIAHGFAFLNLHYVHDSLIISADFYGEGTWEIALGRYFQPIYILLRGKLAATWLIGVLSLFYISILSFIVCDIFEINSKKELSAICGFLCTNITLTVIYATYIPGGDVFSIACLFAGMSAWCTIKISKSSVSILLGILFLLLSLATYQAYFAVYLTIGVIYFIWVLTKQKNEFEIIRNCLFKAIIVIMIAFIGYFIGQKVSLAIFDIKLASYLDWKLVLDIKSTLPFILKTYKSFCKTYTHLNVYPFISNIIHCLIFVLFISEALGLFVKKNTVHSKYKVFSIVSLVCFFLILPFITNIMYFITRGKNSYELTKFSFYFLYLVPLLFVKFEKKWKYNTVISLLFVIIIFNIITANQIYLKRKLVYDSTGYQVTRLLTKMSSVDGYIEGATPCVFVGHYEDNPLFHNYEEFSSSSSFTGQSSNCSITYPGTDYSFFKYILNTNVAIVHNKEDLINNQIQEINSMPVFPNNGCCKMIDGYMFVKLSGNTVNYNSTVSLVDYPLKNTNVKFYIDTEKFSENGTHIRGWAYHQNDSCKILLEANGRYYETTPEERPDVGKIFELSTDMHGFSVNLPFKVDHYSLFLVNKAKEEIYSVKVK